MTKQRPLRALFHTLLVINFLVAHEAVIAADPAMTEANSPSPSKDPGAPGEHHQHLAALIGEWDYSMLIWNSPTSDPLELTGSSEARWTLGGRFVETYYHGDFQGRPFEGHSIDGYDNQKKKYTNVWRDNLGTYTVVSEGNCTEDGRVRTMSYQFSDPASGLTLTNENVITVIDENTNQSESFIKSSTGQSFKNMELKTTRRGPRRKPTEKESD